MLEGRRIGLGFVAICAAGAMAEATAAAEDSQKVAAGTPATEQLLLLMDKDKNGKVSKAEFMAFMDAEFDRLDVNKDGELDVKELTQLRVRPGIGNHK